jgi:ABC-type nitrate/sulfonate/bicarbonate transport system substrate-binding protein
MKRHVAISGCLLLLVVTSYSFGASATKMHLGYSAITATMAPLWAGRDYGFFAKHGVDAELIYLAGEARRLRSPCKPTPSRLARSL